MLVYLYSFGKMHQAKLNVAFSHIPTIFFDQPEINIIDYGCGQAIGTMCYADFLSQKGIAQKIKKVTLIEPSEICLKRAALHTSTFLPDAEIVTVNKEIEDLSNDDIICGEDTPTLHILLNVFENNLFDIGNFYQVISDNLKGYNQFACVEPLVEGCWLDQFVDFFFDPAPTDQIYKVCQKYELNPDKPWTAHIRCFSFGEMEEDLSTEVTEEDIANGVEDEFGVVYSRDGKRLLKCNKDLTIYIVKNGTKVICDWAFDVFLTNRSLQEITIPNSVMSIEKQAFEYCEALQRITIPNSVTSNENSIITDKSVKSIINASGFSRVWYDTFGNISGVEFSQQPIEDFHKKNFKGLFYHQYGIPLPDNYSLFVNMDETDWSKSTMSIIGYLKANFNLKHSGHPDILTYCLQPFREDYNATDKQDLDYQENENIYACILTYNRTHAALVLAVRNEYLEFIKQSRKTHE